MTETMPAEFPFVQQLPKREKSRLVKLWEHFSEARAAVDEHGMLVPVSLAAELAGVSPQRIHQLVDAEKLVRIKLHGHPFITENSFVTWAKSERKTGRPLKVQTTGQALKASLASARSQTASKR